MRSGDDPDGRRRKYLLVDTGHGTLVHYLLYSDDYACYYYPVYCNRNGRPGLYGNGYRNGGCKPDIGLHHVYRDSCNRYVYGMADTV